MLLLLAIVSVLCFVVWSSKKEDPKPIFGVYKQPGKWFYLKYWLFRLFLCIRKRYTNKSQQNENPDFTSLDGPQPLSQLPQAFDAVFFMATSEDGYYIIAGSERRKHNISNGLFYLVVPDLGLLCSQKLPDTVLFADKDNTFGGEGLLILPVQPMKLWKVVYSGEMWLQSDPSQQFEVTFQGQFNSSFPHFNFSTDLDEAALARSIARETWNREYFENIKKAHQDHYEQMGSMDAKILIEGREEIELHKMSAFRDHSFGPERNWDLMHRYAFHMIFLEDGTKATVGVICQPSTNSVLEAGFLCTSEGNIYPLEWCDLRLYQHGENGTPPMDHAFRFKAGPKVYEVQVNVDHKAVHYVGWKWEARMVERFVKYKVNGVAGRGISEFNYHSNKGRPISASKHDPDWFADCIQEFYSRK